MLDHKLRRNISGVLFIALLAVTGLFWTMDIGVAGGLTDGVYNGSGQGFKSTVELAVTVSGGKVVAIDVVAQDETPFIAGKAFDQLIPAIIQAQSAEIDGVSGATRTSNAIKEAYQNALGGGTAAAVALDLKDGQYKGTAKGFASDITVEVTVAGGKISAVKVVEANDTPGISDGAIKDMPEKFVQAQSTDVDVVSGATMTSKGIIEAVKAALAQ